MIGELAAAFVALLERILTAILCAVLPSAPPGWRAAV